MHIFLNFWWIIDRVFSFSWSLVRHVEQNWQGVWAQRRDQIDATQFWNIRSCGNFQTHDAHFGGLYQCPKRLLFWYVQLNDHLRSVTFTVRFSGIFFIILAFIGMTVYIMFSSVCSDLKDSESQACLEGPNLNNGIEIVLISLMIFATIMVY